MILDWRFPIADCQLLLEAIGNRQSAIANLYVGCSSMVEHRTVTAAREGSSPFNPPNFGTVAER